MRPRHPQFARLRVRNPPAAQKATETSGPSSLSCYFPSASPALPLRLGPAYHSASTAARVLHQAPFKLHHARAATLVRGWTGISLWRIFPNESVGGICVACPSRPHDARVASRFLSARESGQRDLAWRRAHVRMPRARACSAEHCPSSHGPRIGPSHPSCRPWVRATHAHQYSTVWRARISVVRAPTRHLRGTCRRARVGDTASGHSQCALSLVHPRGASTSIL
ncbi:hypothetical protein DFH09DRAFT_1454559 [Mycena vulgaris]|nr:hypothetical protein DFH09DRAFT_1454559 [Mycena vulgaris]